MKTLLAIVLGIVVSFQQVPTFANGLAPAPGYGEWTYLGGNRYRGSSWIWEAYYNCGWHYNKILKLDDPDFYTRYAELQFKDEDNQRKADLLRARQPLQAAGQTVTTGFNILQQGYQKNLVQSGTTVQSTGEYFAPLDVNAMWHEAFRLKEASTAADHQLSQQLQGTVQTAVDGNSAVARIQAAKELALATLAATAPPPVTSATVFQSQTVQQPTGFMPGVATASAQTSSNDAVALLSHGLLMQNCSACHNPRKQSGGLDLTVDPSQLATVRQRIEDAITTGKMPKGKPPLGESVVNGLLAGIPKQVMQQQRFDTPPPQPSDPELKLPPGSRVLGHIDTRDNSWHPAPGNEDMPAPQLKPGLPPIPSTDDQPPLSPQTNQQ